MKTGILLINLGTPDSPSTRDVRIYLRELLSCKRVIDINPLARWFVLNLLILPFRPRKSARAYKKIWMDEGSPLLVFSEKLKIALLEQFVGKDIPLEFGMQCRTPSLQNAIAKLRGQNCDQIIVLPIIWSQFCPRSFAIAFCKEGFLHCIPNSKGISFPANCSSKAVFNFSLNTRRGEPSSIQIFL